MDQQGSNIRVVFRSAPAPTEQRAMQAQTQSGSRASGFGSSQQRLVTGVTQPKVSSSTFSRKSALPNAPYSSGAGSLAVLPDNRASNFGLSGSQRGRPRGRRPLRGQFPVVPMDMVRQLGIEQQVVLQPAAPVGVKNKGTLSKPLTLSRRVQCQPYRSEAACQTEESLLLSAGVSSPVAVPVPVPFYVPIPMKMYTEPTPMVFPVPVPIPVPIVLLLDSAQAQDLTGQLAEAGGSAFLEPETERGEETEVTVATDAETETVVSTEAAQAVAAAGATHAVISGAGEEMTLVTDTGEMLTLSQEQLRQLMGEDWTAEGVHNADLEVALHEAPGPGAEAAVVAETAIETSEGEVEAVETTEVVSEDPGSPVPSEPRAGEKRSASLARLDELIDSDIKQYRFGVSDGGPVVSDSQHRLKFSYGLKAWLHWTRTKGAALDSQRSSETDILRMPIEQLAEAMSTFVKECRKPTGEEYTKDSVFYLCLGLQLYLNENGREVNIFHDPLFSSFSSTLDSVIENYETRINAEGLLLCRIEEEHLWECRQLGAYPQATLLFTLMYFITKHFQVQKARDHRALMVSQLVLVPQRPLPVLRYLPPDQFSTALEISANNDYPLKCPVHLLEYYYSKCPRSRRADEFYLAPNFGATMDSDVWFTNHPLPHTEIKRMLSRIRLVKEIQEAYSSVATGAGSGRHY